MENEKILKEVEEKSAHEKSGWGMLVVVILCFIAAIVVFAIGAAGMDRNGALGALVAVGIVLFLVALVLACGFKTLQPNESYVFTLFGKYYGSLKLDGFFWVNPFCSTVNPARAMMGTNRKLSLKAMTLNNEKQKVNDEEGNPI
ncbi:MAG TPA: hypothetical protein H9812_07530 [Candidatus Gallimonas intestinigallinarum]|uniref:Uncharacterized protein n=1 Tax=Candidatus Gallimonas intestinigallinarum TaxID=2838604 RepID=A0A9D2DXR2_9FIRM|nr:hypothetical protein [Candidatus Gallimonas intestinigallinarum]